MSNETPKRQADIEVTITGTNMVLAFSNGDTLKLDAAGLSPAIREQALMHGLKQKLVDAAAIPRDTETGRKATIGQKVQAILAVHDRLFSDSPTWNHVGDGKPRGGLLFMALVRMYDGVKSEQEIREYLERLDKKQQAALRINPRVAKAIDEIRAESADDSINSDDLLNELA